MIDRRLLLALGAALVASCATAPAPRPAEYRAFMVETYNTSLATPADVERLVDTAARANANALFVQVRRRGDSWYLHSLEPQVELPSPLTFDPLAELIAKAHARNIEIHAWAIAASISRDDPALALPRDPRHVFLRHVWDASSGAPFSGSEQWATRSLPDGLRFGMEWYLDFGHPDAAAYTVDVLEQLVRHYEIDGLYLDRVSYPEAPIDRPRGEPYGVNVGYNATSVERFNRRHGRSGNPRSNDPLWSDWRREQVTNFMRRVYLTAKSARPDVIVSTGLLAYGAGPAASGGFEKTESYGRMFQDWKRWAEEGIIDVLVPLTFKREHVAREAAQHAEWTTFAVATAAAHRRLVISGIAAHLNSIEGSLRQARRARAAGASGVVFYSLANTNAAVSSNPYSRDDEGGPSEMRDGAVFFAALTEMNGPFEDETLDALWSGTAAAPVVPARSTHLAGIFPGHDGTEVTLEIEGAVRKVRTDGGGFFGFTDVPSGTHRIRAGETTCRVIVQAGRVTRVTLPCPAGL
jgi:uncharacterized lipoprotein YddW (UPF0748 family)